MSSKKLILAGLLVAGAQACTQDNTMTLNERTVTKLGPAGGEARSADGKVTLTFFPQALTQETEIIIHTQRGRSAIPRLASMVYRFEPSGIMFEQPVGIAMRVEGDTQVQIANVDGPSPQMLDSLWVPELKEVRSRLYHFSSYAALEIYQPCVDKLCGAPCYLCDPADPACQEPPSNGRVCSPFSECLDQAAVDCSEIPDAGEPWTGLDAGSPPDVYLPDGVVIIDPDGGLTDLTSGPDGGHFNPDGGPLADGGPWGDGGGARCVDTHQQNTLREVDILFVVDDSCSMSEEQAALASQFNLMLTTLTNQVIDYRIGITTTDVSATGPAGRLVGSPSVLTSTTPNLLAAFSANVNVGTNGSAVEAGLDASLLALRPPLSTGANIGFMRPNSSILIVYISDEDSQPTLAIGSYSAALDYIRPGQVRTNLIAGELPNGCAKAQPAILYDRVRQDLGGTFSSICGASWSQALTQFGANLGYRLGFSLSQTSLGRVSVAVDGVDIPSVVNNQRVWSHDPITNHLVFHRDRAPPQLLVPNASVEISYDCP